MSFPRRVLWKAENGREFVINTKKEGLTTMEALHEHIDGLRKKHGCKTPDFIHVASKPGYDDGSNVHFDDLPEHLKEGVAEAISNVKPDPKTLN